jgi:uncharacterized protein
LSQSPLLIANPSKALEDLIVVDDSSVDGFEVGPWLTPEQITTYRRKWPRKPFFFHASNLIVEVGQGLGAEERFQAYLACTDSPWVSVHLSIWEAGMFDRLMRGERLPMPDPEQALDRLLWRLDSLVKLLPVPVLVENIEPRPWDGYDFWSRPEYICRVLERSGCDFLLDTGHLRVSADQLGMDVDTYLGQLPLEKVVQVHVSGPRRRRGILLDQHEPLQTVDYQLFESLLRRLSPRVVTLEYIREKEALSKQLKRLRRLLLQAALPT